MNQGPEQAWPQQDQQYDVMAMPQEDLSTYLDLDNMDFGFPAFDNNTIPLQNGTVNPHQHQDQQQQQHVQQHDLNAHMVDATDFSNINMDHYGQLPPAPASVAELQHHQEQQAMGTPNPMNYTPQTQFQQTPSHFQNMPIQNYTPQFNVPPTPNSTEVFPGSAHFQAQMGQQGVYQGGPQFHQNKHDAMGMLTPLVSPQVPGSQHPIEMMPDYTMSGFSFSPLNSPAMYPQNNGNNVQYSHPHTAENSINGSPIDLGIDMNLDSMPEERPRKTRKKVTPKTSLNGIQRTRHTGVTQRRKASISSLANAVTAEAFANIGSPQVPQPVQMPEANKSISPQPLSEALMAPPPKPSSADGFPPAPVNATTALLDNSSGLPPATPASIMRIRPQQRSGSASNTPYMSPMMQQQMNQTFDTPVIATLGPGLEDLRLPDAAAAQDHGSRNATPRLAPQDGRPTPRMLPKLGSAAATPIPSATPMPQILPSPSVAGIKSDSKNRNSRKRNSTSSTLVSPALRPKISPSIKPLLPDGQLSNDTHALLLASKSNYQNLIEGNHLPGVSYPADLSVNLTSKRTSHKIAEQGRRNRINLALQELQTLIPANFDATLASKESSHSSGEGSPEASKEDGAVNGVKAPSTPSTQGNSKAATVEHATAYIKVLQADSKEKDEKLEALKKELQAMKAKLGCAQA